MCFSKVILAVFGAPLLFFTSASEAACRQERTIGNDYYKAKYNCEVVLNGDAKLCEPTANGLWTCQCMVGCRDGKFTRTIGTDYYKAKYNCEVVLNGSAKHCQPGTNGLWYCDCYY